MSFLAKIYSNVVGNNYRISTCGSSIKQLIAPQSRNFHMMMRPIAATTLSCEGSLTSLMTPTAVAVNSNVFSRLLQPFNSLLTQVAGFKVKGRLQRRCKDCYFVVRQQRFYVMCPTHPRHKQMSMKKRDYKTWILTHATQSKIRPY